MKNIGLIGLVVALLLVFGGYISYQVTMPDSTGTNLVTEEKKNETGAQFLQMKPDSLPPVTKEEAGEMAAPVEGVSQTGAEKVGVVSGVKDEDMAPVDDGVDEASKTEIDQPGVVVSMTDAGFFPSLVTVSVGTKVSFVNDGQALHWPASDPHPAHDALAGFDAGSGLATGDSYGWQFNERGEWGFHDHLNPDQTGRIVVE